MIKTVPPSISLNSKKHNQKVLVVWGKIIGSILTSVGRNLPALFLCIEKTS